MFLLHTYGSLMGTPTGYTLLLSASSDAMYYRIAQAGDTAPTVSAFFMGPASASISAYRGCNPDGPFGAISSGWNQQAASGNNLSVSAITTINANAMVVFAARNSAPGGSQTSYSSWASGGATPAQNYVDYASAQAQVEFAESSFIQATAGSTGACSVVDSATGYSNLSGMLIELVPSTGCNVFYAGIGTVGSAATSCTPGLPTGWQPGDIFICQAQNYSGTPALSISAGWTLIAVVADYQYRAAWWRRAQAGDTAPTLTISGGYPQGLISAWRGSVASGSPIDAASAAWADNSAGGSTLTVPAISTLAAKDYVIFLAQSANGDTLSSWSGTPTPVQKFNNSFAVAARFVEASAGSTGDRSVHFTGSAAGVNAGMLLALKTS